MSYYTSVPNVCVCVCVCVYVCVCYVCVRVYVCMCVEGVLTYRPKNKSESVDCNEKRGSEVLYFPN